MFSEVGDYREGASQVKVSAFFSDSMIVFPIAIQFRVFRSWTKEGVYDPVYTLMLSCLWFHLKFDFGKRQNSKNRIL